MWLLNTLVILSIFGAICGNPEVETEDGILVLTTDNFQSVIDENNFVLVEFYAPWCGHCISFAPEYVKIAQQLEETGSVIKVAKVDSVEEKKLHEEHRILGFPTLKFFRHGIPLEYTGDRQPAVILKRLNQKLGPDAIEIENVDGAEEFINRAPVALIGFFKDRESDEAKTFVSVADETDIPLGITSSDDVYAKYEAESGSIILFKNYDEGKSVFFGESTKEAIIKFIDVESTPLVFEFSRQITNRLFGGDIKNHLFFFISKEANHAEEYIDPIRYLAKLFRNKVLFVAINVDEEENQRILEFFGLKKEDAPLMRSTLLDSYLHKYKPENSDFSPENIKSFVRDLVDGELKSYLLSQELPEDWDQKPVKTLVASNFDEIVYNKDKGVLVEFYAPWCERCKELEPIFDELGEKYKDDDTILIARIDSSVNELEHTKPTSYPSLKYYKKGDNTVTDYIDSLTLEDLLKFLERGGEPILNVNEEPVVIVDQVPEEEISEEVTVDEQPTPKEEL